MTGIVLAGTGETIDPWYLMGGASVAALLLPLFSTPLAWVVVELLVHQTRASNTDNELPTDTVNNELQSKKGSDPPSKQDEDNSKATTNEGFQSSLDTSPTADDVAQAAIDRRSTAVLKAREAQLLEAEVYDVQPHKIDSSKFQPLNAGACAMLYIALMCFSFSIVCCKLSL